MSNHLLDPGDPDMIDRVLTATGGGRFLHVGLDLDRIVATYRRRAVHATGLTARSSSITSAWRLPYADRSFDLVCAYGILDDLSDAVRAHAFGELLRVTRRGVLLHASGRLREQWETDCLQHACRKHPLHQVLVPYEGLDYLPDPSVMLFERLPDDVAVARAVTDLAAGRDLHMDMLREGGCRADAHVARYMFARQFIRMGDRVLDAACGLGYGSAILVDGTLAQHVLGLDVDASAIQYAADHYGRQRARLAFDARDLATLDERAAGSFDAVVSFETLEHIADPDAFLAHCRRLLTPGGRLICSVPNAWVDETGRDPNPHHLHVFDRPKLETLCRRHFLVEGVYGQTAGRGMKLPRAGRALWPAGAGGPDAEWWLLAGMTAPTAGSPAPFRHGQLEYPADDASNVLAFDRDYDNPWLARAMVTMGLRTASVELLEQFADATLAAAGESTADAGAALCVTVYRHLERGDDLPVEVLERIERYQISATSVPHVARWQISLRYAVALYWLQSGAWDRAIPALEACALSDALVFSPLLATKTVGAALLRGWMAAETLDVDAARRWWTLGVHHAERALQRPWDEFLLSRRAPALFGLREATAIVDLASRCAAGLHLLPHLPDRPGILAAQIFESPAERAHREAARGHARVKELEQELEAVRVQLATSDARATRAELEVARLPELSAAARLLGGSTATLPEGLRYAIFGTGRGGRQALDMLRSRGGAVDCFTDNDASRHGTTIDGVPVVHPAMLPTRPIDVIAVASLPGRRDIVAQLEAMGYRLNRDVAIVAPDAAPQASHG